MKIYIIRHGESKANALNIFLGHGDMDLSERGYLQAQLTAKYLSKLPIDAIYSSDLLRAYHTAEATSKLTGVPIIKDKNLREINGGKWEFMPYEQILEKYKQSFTVWYTDFLNARCDGGESTLEVQERISKTMTEIAKNNPDKNVLVFSHGATIRCFMEYLISIGDCENKKLPWASNASVTEIEYVNGKFKLIDYSRDDFLADLSTGLPSNI